MASWAYTARCYMSLEKDSNWDRLAESAEACMEKRASILSKLTGDLQDVGLKNICKPSKDLQHMPYGYGTIKAKCHQGSVAMGAVHTCPKPGHSCIRRVCAWACCEMGIKRLFKKVGRAVSILVATLVKGFDVCDLKSSAGCMRTSCSKLLASGTHACIKCKTVE